MSGGGSSSVQVEPVPFALLWAFVAEGGMKRADELAGGERMPFLGLEHWTEQFFAGRPAPDDVPIPVSDVEAWQLYPEHRWVYNKLLICETQNLAHAPHGVVPDRFPVFSKPIYNLLGLGAGSRVIHSEAQYYAAVQPGHLWMELLSGPHVSTDVALEDGVLRWCRHATAAPGPLGTFDYFAIHAARDPALEEKIGAWIAAHLRGFTGIVNLETIGGTIIECHLRMADQWANLNGPGWLEAVVGLYADGQWRFRDIRRDAYSVLVFMPHGVQWRIDRDAAARLARTPGIESIQITFDDETPAEQYSNPPGGFRAAIINCWDLAAGQAVRSKLEGLLRPADEPTEAALAIS